MTDPSDRDTVIVDVSNHIAHVRLNRPEKRNALDGTLMDGLVGAAGHLAGTSDVWAIVLSGEGPSFCAGLDTANFAAMAGGELSADTASVQAAYADRSPAGANRAQQVAWSWQEVPQPVIAAVHGAALGGGLNLALGADLRVVHPDASLGFVEITWGLIPDMSASQSLRRLVGLDRAKQLMLTGERLDGRQAAAWGLATEVSDTPVERALELAAVMTAHNPEATRAAKAVLNGIGDLDVADGLVLETERSGALLGAPNQVEAVTARLESRPPDFAPPGAPG
jgi:enoyl-CoA hydratase/carnithine racemase